MVSSDQTPPDYYAQLGVATDADADTIKRAYRRLARKFHPDVSKETDATTKFKTVAQAYEILGDPAKRTEYDEARTQSARTRAQYRSHRGRGATVDANDNVREIFKHIFGDATDFGEATDEHARGVDLRARLALTLEEAFAGTSQELALPSARTAFASADARTLRVRVPPGTAHGQELRLAGQGGPGEPPGDLYVRIEIAPHPLFTLEGADVLLEVPLAPWEAVLGTRIRVPTLGGSVEVKIPAGQNKGARLRLRGRGMPAQKKRAAGDQYLVFSIDLPSGTSAEERALYAQLAQLPQQSVRAHLER